MDFATFEVAFERMVTAFRTKLTVKETRDMPRIYFRALQTYPLDVVLLAGKWCVDHRKKLPPIVDWIEVLASRTPSTGPADARHMRVDELNAHERAAGLCYADAPCSCLECQAAGVDHLELRFVPTEMHDTAYERAYNARTKNLELVGHWAHGVELQRWYAARDAFNALRDAHPVRGMRLLAAMREIGMEG
jgi:hypothetical protein